jgi:hypothetical protein
MASIVDQDVRRLKETDPEYNIKFYRLFVFMQGFTCMEHILKQHKDIDDTPTNSQLSRAWITIADGKSDRNRSRFGYEEKVSEEEWLVRPLSENFCLATDT